MNVRLAFATFALAVLAAPLSAQDAPWSVDQTDVAIPMRDGKSLAADVFLPAKPGKYPVVVVQTPYNRVLNRTALVGMADRGFWDREHYAYVIVDWRGFFGSRAAGRAGIAQRGQDGFDVVEWTAAQSWCDGKVGTWGPSALGRVQLDTAAENPPHLVCCVPVVAPIGQRYEDYYEGGVFKQAHAEALDILGFAASRLVAAAPLPDAPAWKFVASLDRTERLDVPMFFVTGWYDLDTARELGSFRDLLTKGGPKARDGSKLLVGPWTHVGIDQAKAGDLSYDAAAGEAARETKLFFDFHLRGAKENGWAARPRVRTWRCNENGWFAGDSWPAKDAATWKWTLHADGTIDPFAPGAAESPRRYVDDPASPLPTIGGANLPLSHLTVGPRDQAPLLDRDDALVYTTAPLDAPLRLDGEATISAQIRADAPDVDLCVRLCEVTADGRTMLVGDSIQRVQLRHAPRREPLAAGATVDVVVRLPPLAYTFPKDGRLRLILSGSNWPRYERNPHTGDLHFDPAKSSPAHVEVVSASIVAPVLPDVKPPAPAPK